jgi:hypothetical protein
LNFFQLRVRSAIVLHLPLLGEPVGYRVPTSLAHTVAHRGGFQIVQLLLRSRLLANYRFLDYQLVNQLIQSGWFLLDTTIILGLPIELVRAVLSGDFSRSLDHVRFDEKFGGPRRQTPAQR